MTQDIQKYAAIIKSLHAKTDAKSLEWEHVEGAVEVGIGLNKTVSLSEFHSNDGEPYERLTVRNNFTGGEVVFVDSDLPRWLEAPLPFESWYLAMKALREKAQRQASGVDGILDDLISDLGAEVEEDDLPF